MCNFSSSLGMGFPQLEISCQQLMKTHTLKQSFFFFATSMPFLFEPDKISRDSLIHCKKFPFPQNPRTNQKLGGAFNFFCFHPEIWGHDPI